LGPYESVEVLDAVDIVEEFKEHGENGYWVGLGTDTAVIVTNGREGDLAVK
jgi:hypothetical protein